MMNETVKTQWERKKPQIKHEFKLVNADTDSISVCRADGSEISEEEQWKLINDINKLMPPMIQYDHDGYYKTVVVIKAKNYILDDGKKIKYKGSALKATTKEKALQEFIKDIINAILLKNNNYVEVYNKYVKEIIDDENIDISRWSSKKTITDKVLNPKRTNEQKVYDAIQGYEYQEGDKAYFFFKADDSLSLVENFDGDYNKIKLLEKLYKTSLVFQTVIPKETFINYKLKKNQKLLENFLTSGSKSGIISE